MIRDTFYRHRPFSDRTCGPLSSLFAVVAAFFQGAASAAPSPVPSGSDFAVYATGTGCGAINISGNAYTDSFDSSLGSYSQTKQLSQGNVGVSGNISLKGNPTINGSIFAVNTNVGACVNGAPGISLSGKATATGGYVQLSAAPSFPNPPPVTPGSQNYNFTANASLPPGSYGNITVSGGKTLTLSPGTYNINSISVSGKALLTVNPSGLVIINVAGNNGAQAIDFSGGEIDNTSGIPLNFQFIYGGTSNLLLSGGLTSHALVYAPNAAVKLSGGADWFGALIVNTLDDSGGVAIHYDRSLSVPPTITALISPAPNAAGWNNSNVTVTFTCTDLVVGIASCTSPVTLTTEGANQIVMGAAVNNEGLKTSTSVTINIDKTPPNVTVSSPPNGATVPLPSVVVSGSATDLLSGVASVTCQGSQATLNGSNFTCSVPLVQGANTISVKATDVAGNVGTASLTVTESPPLITSVTPASGRQGATNAPVTITGNFTHFSSSSVVTFANGAVTAGVPTAATATSITVPVSITAASTLGATNVTVTTGAEVVTLANGFTVTAGTPVITQVNPNTGQQGASNVPVTITGSFTHFSSLSVVSFANGAVTAGAPTAATATSLTVPVSITAAALLGATDVTVTTGTEAVTLANGFTVNAGTPMITLVNPNNGQQGASSIAVTITGNFTHFGASSVVTFANGAVTSGVPTSATATSIMVPISITATASLGATNVTVTTGTEAVTLASGFTVSAGTPVITQVNPNSGQQGTTNVPVTITGNFTHFGASSVVTFANGAVTAAVPTTATATSLTVPGTITAASRAGRDQRDGNNGRGGRNPSERIQRKRRHTGHHAGEPKQRPAGRE